MNLMLGVGVLAAIAAGFAAMGYKGRAQVVGVDLGTTFSVVAIKHEGKVTVIPDYKTGKMLLPSVVSFLPDRFPAVGHEAVGLRDSYPQHTIFNAKRFIGRQFRDVSMDAASHPFRVATNPNNVSAEDAGFLMPPIGRRSEKWVSPVDVGGEVVKRMFRSVFHHLGYSISRAAICVPAKFGADEAKATIAAFEKAWIKVDRVLEEPTAAAIAYNLHKGTGIRHVLVYDIGGGTLDTSLLYMNGKAVSVMGVSGDDHLGGSDFDVRMRDLLIEKLPASKVVATSSLAAAPTHSCDKTGFHSLGEEAKIALSNELSVEVYCKKDTESAAVISVTREEFEQASDDLFRRSLAPVEKVLQDQMMSAKDVDDVVLVGGASRTPRIRHLLQEYFEDGDRETKLHTEIDPDITVAYGAANVLD